MTPRFKYRFVDFGTRFVPRKEEKRTDAAVHPHILYANEIAVDVGSECYRAPGDPLVIDHHFTREGRFPSASAAVLHLSGLLGDEFPDRSGVIWLVTHRQPDFDAFCSQYLVKCILESTAKVKLEEYGLAETGWVDIESRDQEQTRTRIDWYSPPVNRIKPALRWQVKLASYASLIDNCRRLGCAKHRALHSVLYAALHRGRDYLNEEHGATEFFDEVRRKLERSELNPAFDDVFGEDGPFEPELALLEREVEAYARDVRRARQVIVYVPTASEIVANVYETVADIPLMTRRTDGGFEPNPVHWTKWGQRRSPVDGIYLRDPQCLLFKEWARLDPDTPSQHRGFPFTAIAYTGERERGSVNTTDYFFSLDPERALAENMHLYPVWARLQIAELEGIRNRPGEALRRKGLLPRREFEARARQMESLWHDPWFDGGNYACTLVATPNDGTMIGDAGRESDLWDDPVAALVRQELEQSIYSDTVHVRDHHTTAEGSDPRSIPLAEIGRLLHDVEQGRLRFARVGLHPDVDTGLGPAGREIGEFLWRLLHATTKTLPPDFTERHLAVDPYAVSVWSLNGVAVASKAEAAGADEGRAATLEGIFGRIVRLRRSADLLLSNLGSAASLSEMERQLTKSEERLSEFAKLQYTLTMREHSVLRQFFDAIRLQDVLEIVRDRHASVALAARTEELRKNTWTTAEVQSKLEWLEVLFLSFYSIECAHVLHELRDDHAAVRFVAGIGLAFLLIAMSVLRPNTGHRSGGLLFIVLFLAALLGTVFFFPGLLGKI
jgi:hypothetical protein